MQDLYERDPEWYYFYNAIDSLITILIHYKLKSIESPCAVSSVTLVPLQGAFGQVALGTANVFEEFYNKGMKVVWDYDAIERKKIPYEGAFCGCVPGRYEFTVCFDFASLLLRKSSPRPSLMKTQIQTPQSSISGAFSTHAPFAVPQDFCLR